MINTYKILCLEDYDFFCKEYTDLNWFCGSPLSSLRMRDVLSKRKFPIYLEINTSTNEVVFLEHCPKKAFIYSPKEEPVSLMANKREQGIYFVNEKGKEIFCSIKDFLHNPQKFIDLVIDSSPLKVGDIVKVIDAGQSYSTYSSWFEENNVSINIAARYSFGNDIPANDQRYKILAVGKHNDTNQILYAITSTELLFVTDNTIVYLIGAKGVEKVIDRMQYSWD